MVPRHPPYMRELPAMYKSTKKQQQKTNTNKLPGVRKLGKLLVRKTNSKIVKKKPGKKQEDRTRSITRSQMYLS